MKNFLVTTFFSILLSLTFVSHPLFAKSIPIYSEEDKKIIQTKNQPEFMIQLQSNPTTGYSWFLKSYDKNYIRVIRHAFVSSYGRRLIGGGGVEQWTFQLTPEAFSAPHLLTIKLVYERPWESNDVPDSRVFQVMTQ